MSENSISGWFGIASLLTGVFAGLFFCVSHVYPLALPLGGLGFMLGLVALNGKQRGGHLLAILGLVVSGLVFASALAIAMQVRTAR